MSEHEPQPDTLKEALELEMQEFAEFMGERRLFTRGQLMEHMDGMLDRYMDRYGVEVEPLEGVE